MIALESDLSRQRVSVARDQNGLGAAGEGYEVVVIGRGIEFWELGRGVEPVEQLLLRVGTVEDYDPCDFYKTELA